MPRWTQRRSEPICDFDGEGTKDMNSDSSPSGYRDSRAFEGFQGSDYLRKREANVTRVSRIGENQQSKYTTVEITACLPHLHIPPLARTEDITNDIMATPLFLPCLPAMRGHSVICG